MKKIKSILVSTIVITFLSCGGGASDQPANAEGFTNLENEIKNEFGDSAYFTDIFVSHDSSIGNIVSLTVTDAPETLKMTQWNLAKNSWTQSSEVVLELPEGTQAKDFMFQLDKKISLTKVGELIEKSAKKLEDEKNIKNPKLSNALIKMPKNGDITKMEYSITMKPENGGTSFRFYYALNGDLIKMDY